MGDDLRANVLFSALAGERTLLDDQEDDELRALSDLGARLEALGPAMAAMARAENAFDPSFAAGLHRSLLAAHPASVQPEPIRAGSAARKAARTARRISRRMLTLVLLALALVATVVFTILHGAQQTVPVGTGVLSPTATQLARSARSFAANAPSSPMSGHGLAGKTPGARTFGPMALHRAPSAAPSPSRKGNGPATPAPATDVGARGVAGGAAPNGTPRLTPGLARIATAPGPSTPTVIPEASRQSGGPMLGAAAIPSVAGGGAIRDQLPRRMPSLPSTVSLYRLRPAPISPAEIQAITATFPGLKPHPGTNGLEFSKPNEQLQFAPTTGEIRYANPYQATGAPPSATDPSTISRDWLRAHRLFPAHAGSLTTTVTSGAHWTTVRIVPTLHPAILPTAQIPAITVVVDHQGVVTSARIRWATVESAGTTAVISPIAATQANQKSRTPTAASGTRTGQPGTQAGPLFTVTSVTLAYQPISEGATLVLRPVYLFRGTLEGRPFSQIAAAEAR